MNKSFLKWAGGQGQLVDKIISLMPLNRKKRYLEPFVGSGVVALNVDFPEIIIGDVNPGLIALWKEIQDEGEYLITRCREKFMYNTETSYYIIQAAFNCNIHTSKIKTGAAFLYLNRHCFNGLCRFNSRGEFNVPFGRYKNPYFPEKELLHAVEVSKKMTIIHQDFTQTLLMATYGDVIYNDPPYIPINKTSNFTAYSQGTFDLANHEQLVWFSKDAVKRGATVIISNNDVPAARKLYSDATEIHFVDVRKNISCKSNGRKKQGEIIAIYKP